MEDTGFRHKNSNVLLNSNVFFDGLNETKQRDISKRFYKRNRDRCRMTHRDWGSRRSTKTWPVSYYPPTLSFLLAGVLSDDELGILYIRISPDWCSPPPEGSGVRKTRRGRMTWQKKLETGSAQWQSLADSWSWVLSCRVRVWDF